MLGKLDRGSDLRSPNQRQKSRAELLIRLTEEAMIERSNHCATLRMNWICIAFNCQFSCCYAARRSLVHLSIMPIIMSWQSRVCVCLWLWSFGKPAWWMWETSIQFILAKLFHLHGICTELYFPHFFMGLAYFPESSHLWIVNQQNNRPCRTY